MPRRTTPDSDSILDTDDEVNEFEQAVGSEEEGEGIAQWEPDAWDEGEGDEEDSSDEVSYIAWSRSLEDYTSERYSLLLIRFNVRSITHPPVHAS
jgi:hypothetical protein